MVINIKRIKQKEQSESILTNNDLLQTNTELILNPNELIFGASLEFSAYYARSGKVYTVSTGPQAVAANGFLLVQLTNPAISGKTMYIDCISGGSITNTTVDMLKNASFADAGTALTPHNTNWSFSDTSIVTGKYLSQATDPTTGGTLLLSIIQTGGPDVVDFGGRYIVSSGQLYIRLTNNINQTSALSINITWWEI